MLCTTIEACRGYRLWHSIAGDDRHFFLQSSLSSTLDGVEKGKYDAGGHARSSIQEVTETFPACSYWDEEQGFREIIVENTGNRSLGNPI